MADKAGGVGVAHEAGGFVQGARDTYAYGIGSILCQPLGGISDHLCYRSKHGIVAFFPGSGATIAEQNRSVRRKQDYFRFGAAEIDSYVCGDDLHDFRRTGSSPFQVQPQ